MAQNLRNGYKPDFLGNNLPFPKLGGDLRNQLATLKYSDETELKYTHFSCVMHKTRMLPVFTAVNIKGDELQSITRKKDVWSYDNRMEESFQLGEELYSNDLGTFDRGHMVRRMDPAWGDDPLANQADVDTFHFTNCTPQHAKLNRKIWQELERHVLENGASDGNVDISVFTGPVLRKDDKIFINLIKGREIQIPVIFWKIIVWKKKTDDKLYAVGFMQSQWPWVKSKLREPRVGALAAKKVVYTDDYFEHLEFKDGKTYQVAIPEIEKITGLKFSWDNVIFPYKGTTFNEIKRVKKPAVSPKTAVASTTKDVHKAGGYYRLKNVILG